MCDAPLCEDVDCPIVGIFTNSMVGAIIGEQMVCLRTPGDLFLALVLERHLPCA